MDRILNWIPDSGIYPYIEGLFLPVLESDEVARASVRPEEPFQIVHLFGAWVILLGGLFVSIVAGIKEFRERARRDERRFSDDILGGRERT